ncbi:MAG TPA: hypothetical protein VKQ29_13135 [Aliidongia sp.]|nr:hypothetical protein [Aliidongia sp.]
MKSGEISARVGFPDGQFGYQHPSVGKRHAGRQTYGARGHVDGGDDPAAAVVKRRHERPIRWRRGVA